MRLPSFAALLALGLIACGGPSAPAPTCSTAATCPAPASACQVAICTGGACGTSNLAAGTRISDPTPGDCKSNQCDGNGVLVIGHVDDTDLPSPIGSCTTGTCTAGVPGQANKVSGTTCATGGGTKCDGNGTCVQCVSGTDCTSGVCASNACQAPTCLDHVKNGWETDVDCGGANNGSTCLPCADGKACSVAGDCASGVCTGNVCQAPTCTDGVKNGAETDVDCGGPACLKCGIGKACLVGGDCTSAACMSNVCVKALGAACASATECGSGFCVDSVCCNTACTGTCTQCNLGGSVGTCSNAPTGSDPHGNCTPAASPSTCGNAGTCSGAGACAVYIAGTTCAPASCSAGSFTPARTCDGVGTCSAVSSISCSPYVCNSFGSACLSTCTTNADCASPFTCQAGVCK